MWHWVDGEFYEDADARLPVADRGFLYGDGCWDSFGVWEGRLIHLEDHLARLYQGVRMLKLAFAMPPDELRGLILEAAVRNDIRSWPGAVMRVIVTRGSGPVGLGYDVGEPSLVILSMRRGDEEPLHWRGGTQIMSGVMSSYTRPPSTTLEGRVKSLNYLTSVLAELEARERGADIAILRNTNGHVAEGHAMNVFAVRGGALYVPAESDGGLAGVTRAHVIATAHRLQYPCYERSLTAYDFICADEAFLTAASAGMRPLGTIDGRALGLPAPGPVTAAVREAYVAAAYDAGTPVPA